MNASLHVLHPVAVRTRGAAPPWWLNREAARNWLALGLLLGAWNAVDDRAAPGARPDGLRGYGAVSVRAVQRQHVGE